MGNKRVLNWGWYGFENYGDDLLQQTMILKLREENIDLVFPMQSKYHYEEATEINRSYKELFYQVKLYDVLIVGPGGLFPFSNVQKLVIFYLAVLYWKYRHKKVIFFGIGISERIDGLSKRLWRRIIRYSDLFFTRDEGFLDAIGVTENGKVQTMADVAFASGIIESCKDKSEVGMRVAIAVANLCKDGDKDTYSRSIKTWQAVCKKLLGDGYKVDLIAFTKGKDDMLINDIASSIRTLKCIGEVQQIQYKEVSNAVARWNEYEQVICMRFHSLVLSILANVPALPVAYGHKTASLAKTCGLADYLLYWNSAEESYFGKIIDTDAQSIIDKFSAIEMNRDTILEHMSQARKKLTYSAEEAINALIHTIR